MNRINHILLAAFSALMVAPLGCASDETKFSDVSDVEYSTEGNGGNGASPSDCPSSVDFDIAKLNSVSVSVDEGEVRIPKKAVELASFGEKDIITLTLAVLDQISQKCLENYKVHVRIVENEKLAPGFEGIKIPAPDLFLATGYGLIEDLSSAGLMTGEEALEAEVTMINWWQKRFPKRS